MPADIRDLISYRLALLAGLNDRSGHAHVSEMFDVTLGEWRVLGNIKSCAPLTLSSLARVMFVDKGQLSRMVGALVQRGWVRETPSRTDRRTATLSLSAAGRRQHDRIFVFAQERNQVLLTVLDPSERRELHRLVDKLAIFVEAEHAALARGSARQAEAAARTVTVSRAAQ